MRAPIGIRAGQIKILQKFSCFVSPFFFNLKELFFVLSLSQRGRAS